MRDAVAFHRPALVIDTSAFNDVDGAQSRCDEAYAVNALGPPQSRRSPPPRVEFRCIHVSTNYVFDGTTERQYHEFNVQIRCMRCMVRADLQARTPCARSTGAITSCAPLGFFGKAAIAFYSRCMRGPHTPGLRVANDQYGSPTYAPHLAEGIARLIATGAFGTYHMAGLAGRAATSWRGNCFSLSRFSPDAARHSRLVVPGG